MAKVITTQTPPVLFGTARVDFNESDFDVLIQNKGLYVIHEKAYRCPCKSKGGSFNIGCKNCGGSGWVFINPIKTKMVVQSIDLKENYKEWSLEAIGTVTISTRSVDKLGFMDRVTICDSETIQNEIIYPVEYDDNLFAFTVYDIQSIENLYKFNNNTSKLSIIPSEDYEISGNKIILDDKYKTIQDLTLSLRYVCQVQYHIVDLVREIRNSYRKRTKDDLIKLPTSAIGRRTHLVLDRQNFDGDRIFDNSY